MRTLVLGLGILATTSCMMPPQGAALIQQTSQEFNFDTRFGRMELAVEQVAPKYAEEFARKHRTWGNRVRITDAEGVGMRMRGQENCDISVRLAWYRTEEGELHTTLVKQHWHLYPKGWLLDGEDRLDGDIGALGENVEVVTPDSPARTAQFPTVRLGAD